MTQKSRSYALAAGLTAMALTTAGCGQEPSFLDKSSGRLSTSSKSANGSTSGDAQNGGSDPQTAGDLPGADGSQGSQVATATSTTTDTGSTTPPDIPAASPDDLSALHKCLAMWPGNPFTGTVKNYQKISAAVTVGGIGNAVNDTEATAQPFLVLIDAGVNVLGSPSYNLLNPNGYYCMKVNVNVLTDFTINLNCNARLSDSRVDVNVLSSQNDTTSAVGVHVLSTVKVNTVQSQGETCNR